mgnify:FL=1
MKTYLEMNEKVADILQHGGKIEQYAAQYIEELRKENAELKHRAEVAERALELCETAYILALNGKQHEGISQQAIVSDLGVHKFFIEQAEKELSEEQI